MGDSRELRIQYISYVVYTVYVIYDNIGSSVGKVELSDNAVYSIGNVDCSAGKVGRSADIVELGWVM